MKFSKANFFISTVFVISFSLVILAQYIDNKNIGKMIAGNENLIVQYKMSSEIVILQQDLYDLESKIKTAVMTRDPKDFRHFQTYISKIREDETQLRKLTNPNGLRYVDELHLLINQLMDLNSKVINSIDNDDWTATEKIIADDKALNLANKMNDLLKKIDNAGKLSLTQGVKMANMNAQRVFNWGNAMLIILAFILLALFLIIINRVKLVNRLTESEEKLKKAAQVKENFLANMSHEIRTPLNAIMGYTQLIQRKTLDADTRFQVATIQKSGETLLSIVNDILDLSKIESGMIRIEEVDFSLRKVVRSFTTMFQAKIEEKNLKLSSIIAQGIPELLNGDPARLTQIFVNLIGNAIKFTDKGDIRLYINGKQTDSNHIEIEFKLTDTGVGIAEEKLEMIFERFSQAEASTTRHYGGTGLGLAITRELVTLQKGKISVSSKPGSGTTVLVTIPYKIALVQDENLHHELVIETRNLKQNAKVLIVEDNVINQGLMSSFMEEMGVEYKVACNGIKALEVLKRELFDLVFMDIQMPEMDGYQAAREIRHTLKLDLPVIAMTAHAMEGEREKCMSAGMNEHLSKPVREGSLKEIFLKFLSTQVSEKSACTRSIDNHKNGFQVIDFQYMKEVSNGNLAYEKLATEQFISLMPIELGNLTQASDSNNSELLRRIAHSMKSTISIMGLDVLIQKDLDALEYEQLGEAQQLEIIKKITSVCHHALLEANAYYVAL